MKKFFHPRMTLDPKRVQHFKNHGRTCFICGLPAEHSVAEWPNQSDLFQLFLCTAHFARMFKMPANRFEKKKKAKVVTVQKKVREFTLRRHMDIPLKFVGERLVSRHFRCTEANWFLAFYKTATGTQVVSVARVFSKSMAFNIVLEVNKQDHRVKDFVEATKTAFRAHEEISKYDETALLEIMPQVTRFFEDCASHVSVL
jgi:hypothetical protein